MEPAPHDVSIMLYLLGVPPTSVSATGITRIQEGIEDVVFMNLGFRAELWPYSCKLAGPGQDQAAYVVGSKKMVVYDDVDPDAKIRILDKGVTRVANDSRETFSSFGEFNCFCGPAMCSFPRSGHEPLKQECQHL